MLLRGALLGIGAPFRDGPMDGRDVRVWQKKPGRAPRCRCRVPVSGRTGSVPRGYNGAPKRAAAGHADRSPEGSGPGSEGLATVTPYLSQWPETLESASGESWGRLARTIAEFRHRRSGFGAGMADSSVVHP